MKLRRIRYFVTLAETLNFSRTADIHCVSQTTVSQQIKLLERELGCDLFARTKRKVELTAAGSLYLTEARAALQLIDDADEKVRLFRSQQPRSLRFGVIRGISPGYVAGVLSHFAASNPTTVLSCDYCPPAELLPRIIAGAIDVGMTLELSPDIVTGVASGPDPAPSEASSHSYVRKVRIADVRQYVVTSARSPLAQHDYLTRAQLAGESFVNGLESRDAIPLASEDASSAPEPAGGTRTDIMVGDMDELLLALSLGRGYSLLSEPAVQSLDPNLCLAAIPLADERIPLVACCRANEENPAVERLIQTLASHFSR